MYALIACLEVRDANPGINGKAFACPKGYVCVFCPIPTDRKLNGIYHVTPLLRGLAVFITSLPQI
jgi:hypothetical protein